MPDTRQSQPTESKANWTICLDCLGRGKKSKRIRKKAKLRYQRELLQFESLTLQGKIAIAPVRPKGHLDTCSSCNGTGLLPSVAPVVVDKRYPHVAIIGAGIGGVALAVACLHRGIPFTLYERDNCFDQRAQGYGLTLQQASRAIEGLGIFCLDDGVISTRHVVHRTDGKIIGEWGIRKWHQETEKPSRKRATIRTNVHIARQSLRAALLEQLGDYDVVRWGHQLVDMQQSKSAGVDLHFQVDGKRQSANADLLVGADGIRSTVRRLLINNDVSPLRYLGCIAILGICPLDVIEATDRTLLDAATVFQTANGCERIYIMPYKTDSVMWQLSFPMPEDEAKALSAQGRIALKHEAMRRCPWHDPITQLLAATPENLVSGYPVYDRALLDADLLTQAGKATLIGDAAHPMSPFKGQGANQALLDALALARGITRECRPLSQWRETGIRKALLTEFEAEMLERSAAKVKDSAEAAEFLHSETVLHEGNEPRGRCLKR